MGGFILSDGAEPIAIYDELEEAQQEGARLAVLGVLGEEGAVPVPPRWVQEDEESWALYGDDGTTYHIHLR